MGKDALSRRGFIKLGGGALGALVFGSSLAACGQGSAGGSNPAASSGRKVINFVTAKFESTTSMQDFVKPFNDSSSSYQVVVRELPPPSQSTEVHQRPASLRRGPALLAADRTLLPSPRVRALPSVGHPGKMAMRTESRAPGRSSTKIRTPASA